MIKRPFYYKETNAIRIFVRPRYLEDQSRPALDEYVFAYFVRIENVSKRTVQLLSRRWHICDSAGEEYEVAGDGVVGQQPVLRPGDVHEYRSFCVLKSPSGSMEGTYRFITADGAALEAAIPHFLLSTDEPEWHLD